MQANVHTPERLAAETFKQYRARRLESHTINRTKPEAAWSNKSASNPERSLRRRQITACGGIRQFKKLQRAGVPGYPSH